MKKFGLSALAKAINTYLSLDAESQQRLKKMRGKVVAIELPPLPIAIQCLFTETGVVIQTDAELVPDTTIRGTPMQMLGVVMAKDDRQRFFAEDVLITGDAEFGQQVINLFDELDIDWEEYLARIIGDTSAHHATRVVRDFFNWTKKTETSLAQYVSDYVQEEKKWLPSREALQDFFNDIDQLRMDADRLDAKTAQLNSLLLNAKEQE